MIRSDSRTRKITYYSKSVDDIAYEREKRQPTWKQKRFFTKLVMRCKEHELDPSTGKAMHTRGDYAEGIDILLKRLTEAGVDVRGNKAEFDRVLFISDKEDVGRIAKDRLVPREDKRKKPAVDYGMAAAQRALKRV